MWPAARASFCFALFWLGWNLLLCPRGSIVRERARSSPPFGTASSSLSLRYQLRQRNSTKSSSSRRRPTIEVPYDEERAAILERRPPPAALALALSPSKMASRLFHTVPGSWLASTAFQMPVFW